MKPEQHFGEQGLPKPLQQFPLSQSVVEQFLPHEPQLSLSLSRSDSHPLSVEPSQLPQSPEQDIWQFPLEQLADPWSEPHDLVQIPQCATSLRRFVSHPLLPLLSQSPNPV